MNIGVPTAVAIARRDLSACMTSIGYAAGTHHFVDLWARDSLFACFADFTSKECRVTVETFLQYQRKDGLIPYRIRRSSLSLKKYLGHPVLLNQPIPDFRSFQSGGTVYDGGLLTIIVAAEHVLRTHNKQLAKRYYPALKKAFAFYQKRFHKRLIVEWFLCEWADAVLKVGKVLYTNILYVRAAKMLAVLSVFLKVDIGEFDAIYDSLHQLLKTEFWVGDSFADWIDYKRHTYFTAYPHLLTLLWGMVTRSEAEIIYQRIKAELCTDFGVRSQVPQYPWWRIPVQNYLTGTADYHNGVRWLQPWCLCIGVAYQWGDISFAQQEWKKLSECIVNHRGVFENYETTGEVLRRKWYTAEGPFAWSSGLVLWTARQLGVQ